MCSVRAFLLALLIEGTVRDESEVVSKIRLLSGGSGAATGRHTSNEDNYYKKNRVVYCQKKKKNQMCIYKESDSRRNSEPQQYIYWFLNSVLVNWMRNYLAALFLLWSGFVWCLCHICVSTHGWQRNVLSWKGVCAIVWGFPSIVVSSRLSLVFKGLV